MPFHRVKQGECLLSIAGRYGFRQWQTIYDHPNNAALREKRPDPNVLFPGDQIFIPDKRVKLVPRPTEASHSFTMKSPVCLLRLDLEDEDHKPLANKRYRLTFAGMTREDVTPDDGRVEQPVSPNVDHAELEVWLDSDRWERGETADHRFELAIGDLDPVAEVSGVQARRSNLGFRCDTDQADSPLFAKALRAFQQVFHLDPTGLLDDATRARLFDAHEKASRPR